MGRVSKIVLSCTKERFITRDIGQARWSTWSTCTVCLARAQREVLKRLYGEHT